MSEEGQVIESRFIVLLWPFFNLSDFLVRNNVTVSCYLNKRFGCCKVLLKLI